MRLFTALPFPPEILDRLQAIQEALAPHPALAGAVNWTPRQNLHVTLKFIGEVDPRHLPNLVIALGKIPVRPMSLAVHRFLCLPPEGPARVLAAGLSGDTAAIAEIFARLEPTVQPLGVAREARDFRPHVTLGRFKNPTLKRTAQNLFRAVNPTLLPTATFTADHFALIESTLTPGGPIYREVARVPAAG